MGVTDIWEQTKAPQYDLPACPGFFTGAFELPPWGRHLAENRLPPKLIPVETSELPVLKSLNNFRRIFGAKI